MFFFFYEKYNTNMFYKRKHKRKKNKFKILKDKRYSLNQKEFDDLVLNLLIKDNNIIKF